MKKESIVEAALFCAGKPIEPEEIAQIVGLPVEEVRGAIKDLVKQYSSRDAALEIVKVGTKHVMQLRSEYAQRVSTLAETHVSKDLLKTAALIAYHQPILQSNLHKMVGERAYEQVRELIELDLILAKPRKNSLELTTSKSFPGYFGIDATDREGVKKWFREQVQAPGQ